MGHVPVSLLKAHHMTCIFQAGWAASYSLAECQCTLCTVALGADKLHTGKSCAHQPCAGVPCAGMLHTGMACGNMQYVDISWTDTLHTGHISSRFCVWTEPLEEVTVLESDLDSSLCPTPQSHPGFRLVKASLASGALGLVTLTLFTLFRPHIFTIREINVTVVSVQTADIPLICLPTGNLISQQRLVPERRLRHIH